MDFITIIIIVFILFLFLIFIRKKRNSKKNIEEQQRNIAEKVNAERKAKEEKRLAELREEEHKKEVAFAIAEKERRIQAAISQCPGSEQYRIPYQQYESDSKSLNISEFTPISKKRYVAFDLETTGIDYQSNSIIEIAAVRVENGNITAEFQHLVNPGRSIPVEASAVNHITDDMVRDQPMIYEILPAFLSFVGDDVLAAHNASFDAHFISNACMQSRFKVPERFFDTMSLSRYWPESSSRKLTSLASAANIQVENAHRALCDAKTVALLISATNERRKNKKSSQKASSEEGDKN